MTKKERATLDASQFGVLFLLFSTAGKPSLAKWEYYCAIVAALLYAFFSAKNIYLMLRGES